MQTLFISLSYLVASFLFLWGLKSLGHADTARKGMNLAGLGMLLAIIGTLVHQDIISYHWIIGGLVLGTIIGVPMGLWIPMTKMPERIALSHAFGGLAVAIVGVVKYISHPDLEAWKMGIISFEVLLGAITFTGSLMAFGKLQGLISGRPQTFKMQNALNFIILGTGLALIITLIVNPTWAFFFYLLLGLGFLLGVLLVLPIGGADMPVVICLLNSYAGLAAAATGFALENNVLIICGALDGGSGFILGMLMSKAMNRSFSNVLFGAFGGEVSSAHADGGEAKPIHEVTLEDAVDFLQSASSVLVVPGYGMAVAQAQHVVRELAEFLEKNGTEVKYAIHPVAGRMPGHMNVLLAEANIPYEQLVEMDEINPTIESYDVAIVIGANDVVNPAAREDKGSPIYGMPIINVDKAKTVIVMKRSMASGFAGIENPLFYKDNTQMLFGDAKDMLSKLVAKFKELNK